MPTCVPSAMPAGASPREELLLDTSAAVALVLTDHDHHQAVYDHVDGRRVGLAGHAAFETYSVLTRLPPPSRRTPTSVARALHETFTASRYLSASASGTLLDGMAAAGIAGGSVYDALVGATAIEHDRVLVTRDRRAIETYRALGVRVDVLG